MTRKQICRKAANAFRKKMRESFQDRFWSRVDKTKTCWNWLGATQGRGYGFCRRNGVGTGCHRISWEIAHGPIPDKLCVLHKCDNPICVNPDHLFLGTFADNVSDCISKGRRRYFRGRNPKLQGANNPRAKLDDSDVIRMRKEFDAGGITKAELGARFGVSNVMASLIVRRVNWIHVK